MKNLVFCSAGLAMAFCSAAGAQAADMYVPGDQVVVGNEIVTLSGGAGIVAIEGNELAYLQTGSGYVLSKLIWQSVAPMLTAGLDVRLPEGWTMSADAQVALSGNSYMQDFDWRALNLADWTERSQHDDTNLDWYFNGSMKIGRDFAVSDGASVNVNAGLKYIDVQWAAFGGSYVYSDQALRDTTGNFPDGMPAATYHQQLPAVFVGLDGHVVKGDWTFDGGAQAGVTIKARATDQHWQRDLVFTDHLDFAPMLAVSAKASYAVADNMDVFVAGSLDKVFTTRGDEDIAFLGANVASIPDSIGLDLIAGSLSMGVKGKF